MTNFLDAFSAFHTRYYKSKTGKQSSIWLYDQIVKLGEDYASKDVIFSVRKFKHDWAQHSVIATLCPANNASSDDIIILSAHQDSVNQWNPWFGRSPGADDDGISL